jgi:anaerobic magnesium-protoporphyrin IX monomethyl ester cyclase
MGISSEKAGDANPRIFLINPPSYGTGKEKHFERPEHPRIALAYLAAYLKKEGFRYRVIDAKFEGKDEKYIIQEIKKTLPFFAGITAMTPEIEDAAILARNIKSEAPEINIILGGPHITALPVETLQEYPWIDLGLVGEGEISLNELMKRSKSQDSLSFIPGLVYRRNGQICFNSQRQYIHDLDQIPFPDWDSFLPARAYPILSSRGCPYKCNFCMRISGQRLRKRSPENVLEEIDYLINSFSPKKLTFHDETFGLDKKWTHQILDGMIEREFNKKIRWEATTRVDMADYDLFVKMKKANCSFLGFGIESGNPEILKQTKKKITLEQAERAVELARKARLSIGSMFIIGHPNETREAIKDTINFAAKLDTDMTACGIMVPYPGTEIAEMVKQGQGNYRLLSSEWKDFNKQVGNALELRDIPRKDLEYFQLRHYLKFYLMKFRFRKLKAMSNFLGFKNILPGVLMIIRHFLKRKLSQEKKEQ